MENTENRGTLPGKQKKKKSVARRIVGIALLLLLLYLVYFIVGMSAPFLPLAKTSPGTRDPASYRGDGTPWVERASKRFRTAFSSEPHPVSAEETWMDLMKLGPSPSGVTGRSSLMVALPKPAM